MAKELPSNSTSFIAQAVAPLKVAAMDAAEKNAREYQETLRANLEAAGWEFDKVAPRPNSWTASRHQYKADMRKRDVYQSVTSYVRKAGCIRMQGDLNLCEWDEVKAERSVQKDRDQAAANYEAYVHKLDAKVGAHIAAELHGIYLWSNSTVLVTLADGTQQKWNTKVIINRSVLGLLFNQWPTRLVK